jgi:dTDP-4-dehydrorhamnose reductase
VSRTTRILVSGGDGILAQALRPYFPLATYCNREEMDVANAAQVRSVFHDTKPELVIHCAAVTSHNAEPVAYDLVNVEGTRHMVAQSQAVGGRVIFPSTDYLGTRREGDPVAPVNAYAASKYSGELCVSVLRDGLVVRGSWYSRYELTHAATDAYTSKLPVEKAAYYIAVLATSAHTGVVNIGGQRRSYYEIALAFNERVIPVERRQLRLPYEIPRDCSLDTSRLNRIMACLAA